MSKRLQRYACVLLAVMMVWAVMPAWGVAESPTTPSDLPDVTAVPTEMPTEVPTEEPAEVPTEVPVEEVPPVLVEEVEQPPMLMAAADELAKYGLVTYNGGTYELTLDANGKPCITLKTGNWYNQGSILAGQIAVQHGAGLTINGESHNFDTMNVSGILTNESQKSSLLGKVTINGGTLIDRGGHFGELHVNGGSATFRGGTGLMTVSNKANVTITDGTADIVDLEAKDSNISVINSAKVGTASLTNCVIKAEHVGFTDMTVNNTSGTFDGGGSITNFYVEKLPTNETLTTSRVSIANVSLPEDVLKALAKEYADKVFSLVGGEIPPTGTYPTEYGDVSIEYQGLHLKQFNYSDVVYFDYTPVRAERIPYDVKTWQYKVECYLGLTSKPSTIYIPVPVARGTREIVLSGGTIEKVYDGKADFVDVQVTDPQWTLDGEPFTFDADTSVSCTVTGTASGKDSGTYEKQTCTSVAVTVAGPLADDISIVTTTGTVDLTVTKRPVTISGTVYKNADDYTIKMIDYIKQGNVVIDGLAEGDTVEQLDPDAKMEAYDANDWYMTRITSYTKGEKYRVVRLTETKNYIPQPSKLYMYIRRVGTVTFTPHDYTVGDTEFIPPTLTSEEYDVSTAVIKYSLQNAFEQHWVDDIWGFVNEKRYGTFEAHAIIPAQGELEALTLTETFIIDGPGYVKSYTLVIPPSIELKNENLAGEITITCTELTVSKHDVELKLSVSSRNGWKLQQGDATEPSIKYELFGTEAEGNYLTDGYIATFFTAMPQYNFARVRFFFAEGEDPASKPGGNYSDILTFYVSPSQLGP